MPHSSGGGFHGGGFHGGSFHGSSGGRAGKQFSRNYFPGCRHFHYYYRGSLHSVYADYDIVGQAGHWVAYMLGSIACLALLLIIFFQYAGVPEKINSTYRPRIIDNNHIIADQSEAMEAMEKFYDKTGIPIYFVATESDMPLSDASMSQQAYHMYLEYFDTENEWLILYSKYSDAAPSATTGKWAFHGMQGDNTDPVLTYNLTNYFNQQFYNELGKKEVGGAFAEALKKTTGKARRFSFNTTFEDADEVSIYVMFMLVLIIGYLAYMAIRGYIFTKGEIHTVRTSAKKPSE